MKKTVTLTIEVEYDSEKTHPEGLAHLMDSMLTQAIDLLGPDTLKEYGNPQFDEFYLPGAKAVVLPKDFAECERGNTWLSNDGGEHVAWFRLGDDLFLEVSVTPGNTTGQLIKTFFDSQVMYCLANYPGFHVSVLKKTEKQIAQHVNKNLKGWFVHRCNINGVKGVKIGRDGIVK